MASSTLNRTGEQPPTTYKGHGTEALGPSDSSDSGSDIRGGAGLEPETEAGRDIDEGSLPRDRGPWKTAGPDVGDPELDSDSDAAGTGERAAAGRDTTRSNRDIAPDRIETESDEPPEPLADADELPLEDSEEREQDEDPLVR
jgi:hypothetical protein